MFSAKADEMVKDEQATGLIKLSVIIPTLNEEEFIGHTVDQLFHSSTRIERIEIIVIDTGSQDKTLDILQSYTGISSLYRPEFQGRKYDALNEAVRYANGDVLLFLDADTQVPFGFDQLIFGKMAGGAVGGAFRLRFDRSNWLLELIRFLNEIRYQFTRRFFSDQGVFMSKLAFDQAGGFPPKPILAETELCRRLQKMGRLSIIKKPVITSSRRFMKGGVWSVFRRDLGIYIRDILGISTDQKAAQYWMKNG